MRGDSRVAAKLFCNLRVYASICNNHMHGGFMRTTVILKDDLVKRAMDLTKIVEKTALIHAGLEALIAMHARERLISLGGSDSKAKSGTRRKVS